MPDSNHDRGCIKMKTFATGRKTVKSHGVDFKSFILLVRVRHGRRSPMCY
jgi:hypothetical protein